MRTIWVCNLRERRIGGRAVKDSSRNLHKAAQKITSYRSPTLPR